MRFSSGPNSFILIRESCSLIKADARRILILLMSSTASELPQSLMASTARVVWTMLRYALAGAEKPVVVDSILCSEAKPVEAEKRAIAVRTIVVFIVYSCREFYVRLRHR